MDVRLHKVYLLATEEPGDYIFTPSGVLIVLEKNRINLFCPSANYNLYRGAINRHRWEELESGIQYRDIEFRFTDLTNEITQHGWVLASSIPSILRHLYENNPRQLFFLERHLNA